MGHYFLERQCFTLQSGFHPYYNMEKYNNNIFSGKETKKFHGIYIPMHISDWKKTVFFFQWRKRYVLINSNNRTFFVCSLHFDTRQRWIDIFYLLIFFIFFSSYLHLVNIYFSSKLHKYYQSLASRVSGSGSDPSSKKLRIRIIRPVRIRFRTIKKMN